MSGSPVPAQGAPAPEPASLSLAVPCRQCGTEPGPTQWTSPSLSCLCVSSTSISLGDTTSSHDTQGQDTGTEPRLYAELPLVHVVVIS